MLFQLEKKSKKPPKKKQKIVKEEERIEIEEPKQDKSKKVRFNNIIIFTLSQKKIIIYVIFS